MMRFFLFFLLIAGGANAQLALTGAGKTKVTAPTYSGPGDQVSGATAWWGLRGYTAAFSTGTNNAINIRRASDNATTNIVILSSGALDVSTATTFCASTTCFVAEMYDQTGNGVNLIQTMTGEQPQLIFSCTGSLPCMNFPSGVVTYLVSGSITSLSQPYSTTFVGERTANFTTQQAYLSSFPSGFIGAYDTASATFIYAGSISSDVTVSDSALHALQGVYNGSSSIIVVDGTASTGLNAGTGTTDTTGYALGARNNGSNGLSGANAMEAGVWPIGFNSTQYGNLHTNMSGYWGTP